MYTQIDPAQLPDTLAVLFPDHVVHTVLKPLQGFTNSSNHVLYVVEYMGRFWLSRAGHYGQDKPLPPTIYAAWPPEIVQAFADQQRGVVSSPTSCEFPRKDAYNVFGVRDPVQAAMDRAKEDIEIQQRVSTLRAQQDVEAKSVYGRIATGVEHTRDAIEREIVRVTAAYDQVVSTTEVSEIVERTARLFLWTSDGERQRGMAQLRSRHPQFYAMVKKRLEDCRAAARDAKVGTTQTAQGAQGGVPSTVWRDVMQMFWRTLRDDDKHLRTAFHAFAEKLPPEVCSELCSALEKNKYEHELAQFFKERARKPAAPRSDSKTEEVLRQAEDKWIKEFSNAAQTVTMSAAAANEPLRGKAHLVAILDEMQLPGDLASTAAVEESPLINLKTNPPTRHQLRDWILDACPVFLQETGLSPTHVVVSGREYAVNLLGWSRDPVEPAVPAPAESPSVIRNPEQKPFLGLLPLAITNVEGYDTPGLKTSRRGYILAAKTSDTTWVTVDDKFEAPAPEPKLDDIGVPQEVLDRITLNGKIDLNAPMPLPLHLRGNEAVQQDAKIDLNAQPAWFMAIPPEIVLKVEDGFSAERDALGVVQYTTPEPTLEFILNEFILKVTIWMEHHMENHTDPDQLLTLLRWISGRLSIMRQHEYLSNPFPVVAPVKVGKPAENSTAVPHPDAPRTVALAVDYEPRLSFLVDDTTPRKMLVSMIMRLHGKALICAEHFDLELPYQLKEDLLTMKAENDSAYESNFGDFDPEHSTHLLGFKILNWDADGQILFCLK